MPERTKIIDVYERKAFRTIYEAINWCVGANYRYWGRACWPSVHPTDGFRMWFTQLAYVEHGKYVPAANQCLNLICSDGNYHVFDDLRPHFDEPMANQNWKYDLIFSKEVGGFYYFRGVFVEDRIHSSPGHYVSKRVATKVKLIGCPARRLELIDVVKDDVPFDENYLRKHIVSFDVIDSGSSVLSPSNKKKTQQGFSNSELKKVVQKPVINYQKMFPEGCQVKHKSFGIGTVKKVSNGILTINFKDIGMKELGVQVCVKMKLLERI